MTDGPEAPVEPEAGQETPLIPAPGGEVTEPNVPPVNPLDVIEDMKIREALEKLPENQRAAFLGMPAAQLAEAKEILLKGVDYTHKTQDLASKRKEFEAEQAGLRTAAENWESAMQDPERAIRILQAHAGPQQPEQEPFDPVRSILMETDESKIREAWNQNTQQVVQQTTQQVTQQVMAALNQHPVLQGLAAERVSDAARQKLGAPADDWSAANQQAEQVARSEGVQWDQVNPEIKALMAKVAFQSRPQPAPAPAPQAANPQINPTQATALHSAGVTSGIGGGIDQPWLREKRMPTAEERIAFTLKKHGVDKWSDLERHPL